jgi:hypothetical protein
VAGSVPGVTSPAPSAAAAPPAPAGGMGWHVDPWQRHQVRFFDGEQWTEHVADGGFSGLDTAPVADLPRSRPRPAREAPPDDGAGPRVLPVGDPARPTLDAPLLLLDERAGPTGRRDLLDIDDVLAGWVDAPPPSWPRRVVRTIVTAPSTTLTELVVRDAEGGERLRVRRPRRRMAPAVDVTGPSGAIGSVVADRVRQGLRAEVRTPAGEVVGRLEQAGRHVGSRRVVDPSEQVVARLTAVWDVPGPRSHLPPGVLLLDRRAPGGPLGADRADLLLGALLAVDLLVPPPPPAP